MERIQNTRFMWVFGDILMIVDDQENLDMNTNATYFVGELGGWKPIYLRPRFIMYAYVDRREPTWQRKGYLCSMSPPIRWWIPAALCKNLTEEPIFSHTDVFGAELLRSTKRRIYIQIYDTQHTRAYELPKAQSTAKQHIALLIPVHALVHP